MKKPNKSHRDFINYILKCDDQDILEHRMMRLPQVVSAHISHSWTTYADFKFANGKRFYASWGFLDGVKALKECFKDMLEYERENRRRAANVRLAAKAQQKPTRTWRCSTKIALVLCIVIVAVQGARFIHAAWTCHDTAPFCQAWGRK